MPATALDIIRMFIVHALLTRVAGHPLIPNLYAFGSSDVVSYFFIADASKRPLHTPVNLVISEYDCAVGWLP